MNSDSSGTAPAPVLPVATVHRDRAPRAVWLVPFAALLFAGYLIARSWSERGVEITVELDEGHGLKEGDEIRYRGIAVGSVEALRLSSNGVIVDARLFPQSATLAVAGSKFWIVHPRLGLTGIAGIETVIGPHYIAMIPGAGPLQRNFVGLPKPPVVETVQPGDREILLESPRRAGLRSGAPVLYRGVRIGTVTAVDLASDGSSVEARALISRKYVPLIRAQSRFWSIGSVALHVGVTGFSLEFESIETVVAGGIALATPPEAGDPVEAGHRFTLEMDPVKDAERWKPFASIGAQPGDPGRPTPVPLHASLSYQEGWIFKSNQHKDGWVLQLDQGLLGPADLLVAPKKARAGSMVLNVSGQEVALGTAVFQDKTLALLPARVHERAFPASRLRRTLEAEDCSVIGDTAHQPLPISAARLRAVEGLLEIDASVPIEAALHGAVVVARKDGAVIGFLLVRDDARPSIAPLPELR